MSEPPEYFTGDDKTLLACTASTWKGDPGRCRWCNEVFAPPRRRWCSDECANAFGYNHWWSAASYAAKKRDRFRCVLCGGSDPRDVFQAALAQGVEGRLARRHLELQAHHIVPILGKHDKGGCHHHLDGLETLCLHHHLERHHGPTEPQLAMTG